MQLDDREVFLRTLVLETKNFGQFFVFVQLTQQTIIIYNIIKHKTKTMDK